MDTCDMSKKQALAGVVAVLAFWGLMVFLLGGSPALIRYMACVIGGASLFLFLSCLLRLGEP